ncbi:MAG: FAD-dependent oxidoreductase [Pseudomonadota bacterium]|nr:FAD-dependent oxidoreductase [Pseudomonadota bacterium]
MLNVTTDTNSIRSAAIIGSGLAGLTASILLGHSGHHVRVFEKSRGPGGRLAAKRVGDDQSADVGAQYFTIRNPEFRLFLNEWAGESSFTVWDGAFGFQDPEKGWVPFPDEHRYVGVPRMTALSRALSRHVEVTAQTRIEKLERAGSQWRLVDTEGDVHGEFDTVVITAPPAQARDLLAASGLSGLAQQLAQPVEDVLPCWACAVQFTEAPNLPYQAMRPDSDVLYWASNNSHKPGREGGAGPWWVLHATPEWTNANLDTSGNAVAEALVAELSRLWGPLPPVQDQVAHRWLYARSKPSSVPGFLWDAEQSVGLAGDWLSGGRVEGAWDSARQLVNAMTRG